MFTYLDIETSGYCNRVCPTCIRNSYPDREKVLSWFDKTALLPEDVIYSAVEDGLKLNKDLVLCLSHYNEPLMDERILLITKTIRNLYPDLFIYFHTNGDYLTEELAKKFDGVLSRIVVTLYMDEPVKSQRAEWVHTLFDNTIADVILSGHVPTHFSPIAPAKDKYKDHTCFEPSVRVIINHRGDYLLCCDDLIGHFDLGSYPDKSMAQHWEDKMRIQSHLQNIGGRKWHSYCESCPRP